VFHNLTHEPPPLPWESVSSPTALDPYPNPDSDSDTDTDAERTLQSRAFQIGSIGFADAMGILLASIVAVPVEVGLCRMQVRRGKGVCVGL
jgi:battenin